MPEKTHDDIYEAVLVTRERVNELHGKFNALELSVNHQIHDFAKAIDLKLDKDKLPEVAALTLLKNTWVRAAIGIAAAGATAQFVTQYPWVGDLIRLIH